MIYIFLDFFGQLYESIWCSVFDFKVHDNVNFDFNNFRSFLIFSNNSVYFHVYVNVENNINQRFYNNDFNSKPESNSYILKLEILSSVFSLKFFNVFLKGKHESRIKAFVFLLYMLISMLNDNLVSMLNVQCLKVISEAYESMNE